MVVVDGGWFCGRRRAWEIHRRHHELPWFCVTLRHHSAKCGESARNRNRNTAGFIRLRGENKAI